MADRTATPQRQPSPAAILAVVGFSVFIAADDLTVVSTMLRPIIGDLGLVLPDGLDDAAWIVNAYLIAFVAVMPIAGRISDVIGRRTTFVGAYLLFLAGTILIPMSTSFGAAFEWFLAGRVLTAIGGGAMVPVALAVVGDVYPPGTRARALGTLGAIETMGWVWGPLYGAVLVRFLSWQWQFWLNIPLAVVGLAATWWALRDHDRPERVQRVDWLGALLLTVTLVSLNLALLGSAEIQSVSGLDQLTGSGPDLRWLYLVALVTGLGFAWQQRRADDPLLERDLFRGRNLGIALIVNFVVGAALVIAMVDVPLFINSVEVDIERSAVVAGAILSALTLTMAITSYIGGRVTERTWYRPPVLTGVAMSTGAYVWMGATWDADTSYLVFAVQLAVLGAGFGLTVAPTTSAVVDAAPPERRGAAAAVVMVVRLLGFSVGLSALTAWGLARFESLRATIDLPSITDPAFEDALLEAQSSLTAQAIAETFTAAAVVVGAGLISTLFMRRISSTGDTMDNSPDPSTDLHPPPEGTPAAPGPAGDETVEVLALRRRTNVIIGLFALLLAGALVLIALLATRLGDTEDDLAATRDDLARVEAGAALYASQITGFQDLLVDLEPQVSAGIDEAIEGLETFASSTLSFDISVDEEIPISTEFTIDREVEVPIKTSIPINESFDTTIEVDTPLGFSVPLDVTVPVDIEVPVDLEVTIPVNETIPIDQTFPIQLDVPIEVDVGDTELAELTDALAAGLRSLQEVLNGLG